MKRIFVLFLSALSLNVMAQSANRLVLKSGQSIEISTKIVTSNKVDLMGQSMETNGTTNIVQKFDVESVNDTSAVIEQKIKSMQLDMESGMGRSVKFNSDNPEDMKGQMGQVLESTLKQKYKYRVNANGIITKVEEQKEKAKSENDMMSAMLSQMNAGAQAPKAGDKVMFKILPDREVKTGETWTDEAKQDGISRKTVYIVKNVTGDDVVLDFTDVTNISTKQSMMGMDADVKGQSTTKGEIIVDKKTRLLKQSTATVEGEQTMEMQGQTIPTSSKMTITTTVKAS